MPTPSYCTTCTQNTKLCHDVWEVKLRMREGEKFTFRAGQFVLWDVPLAPPRTEAERDPILKEMLARGELRSSNSGAWVENPKNTQPRAYSIGSPPREDTELTFVLRYKEGGRASRFVDEILKVGDEVHIQGPLGAFVLNRETTKDYVFVGTGTGVAPFRSHLLDALEDKKEQRRMSLFFGVRHEEDLFWVDEFRSLERRFQNFKAYISLSQPDAAWKGLRGRVTDMLPTVIKDFSHINAYVCGNPEMVKTVKEWLFAKGVPKEDVHQEGYI